MQPSAISAMAPAPDVKDQLKQIARVPVPHMSCGLIANDCLVVGTSIKQGFITAYNLQTFQQSAKSSSMLP